MSIDWEEILGEEENIADAYDSHVSEYMDIYFDSSDSRNYAVKGEYIIGIWNGEEVRFKRIWGGYEFSEQEITDLLNGKEIRFRYTINKNEQDIIGKLAYLEYKNNSYIGFSPSNWKK